MESRGKGRARRRAYGRDMHGISWPIRHSSGPELATAHGFGWLPWLAMPREAQGCPGMPLDEALWLWLWHCGPGRGCGAVPDAAVAADAVARAA